MRLLFMMSVLVLTVGTTGGEATGQRSPALPPEPPGPLFFTESLPTRTKDEWRALSACLRQLERGSRRMDTAQRFYAAIEECHQKVQRDQRGGETSLRLVAAQQEQDDGFVPVSELPPEEKLPAAPMLVGAYVFVVVALFAYVLSLSRRLSAVSKEIVRLEGQITRGERS